MAKYWGVVVDGQVVAVYDDIDNASISEAFRNAYQAALVPVSGAADVKAAWDEFHRRLDALWIDRAAAIRRGIDEAATERGLVEVGGGWQTRRPPNVPGDERVVAGNDDAAYFRWEYVADTPGGDIYAHGEGNGEGGWEWNQRPLPEWLSSAVQAAREATPPPEPPQVAYLPPAGVEQSAADPAAADLARRRARWGAVARAAWVAADAARAARDWRGMRQAREHALAAEPWGGLGGSLMAAIFNSGVLPEVPAEMAGLAADGESISPEAAKMAKAAVEAEIRSHRERVEARRREQRAAEQARRDAATRAAWEQLPVGAVFQVAQSYRLRKATGGVLAECAGQYVACKGGVAHGDRVRVTRHISERRYGRLVVAEVVVDREATEAAAAEEAAARRAAARAKALAAIEAFAPQIAAAYEEIARRVGGVVVSTTTGEEVLAAQSGDVLGQVLAEDGTVYGLRAADLRCAAEMPRARADWPEYLAGQARPRA